MEFRKMVMITLYARQQKRHRCIEQSFGLCGRGRGWDSLGEWHWNMCIIICETNRQSRFDAWYRMHGKGAGQGPRPRWGGQGEAWTQSQSSLSRGAYRRGEGGAHPTCICPQVPQLCLASLHLPKTQRAWRAGLAQPDHQWKSVHGSDRKPRGRMDLPPRGKGPRGFRAPCSQGCWAVSRGKCSAGLFEVHAGFQVR